MTTNQLEYLKLVETMRANRANEDITRTRDNTTRELGIATLSESSRHNRATEQHNVAVLGEQQRHNVESESVARATVDETRRHNLANEQLQLSANYAAQTRADAAMLSSKESIRHNTAQEAISAQQQQIAMFNAVEQQRANKAREAETQRANVASELEIQAQNQRYNEFRQQEIDLSKRSIANQREYQFANVGLGYAQVGASYANIAEQSRANQAREAENTRSNMAREAETTRSNIARERETTRSNRASEANVSFANAIQERNVNSMIWNRAGELAERHRANTASEAIGQLQAAAAQTQAAAAAKNARSNSTRARNDTIQTVTNAATKLLPLFGGAW